MKKPLHHHIRHHVKKAGKRVTKYLAERDTIFATIWVFIFIVGLGSIPLNLKFLNPIKLALKDFDFNDIAYSKLHIGATNRIDNDIVIINIGYLDRADLAKLIDKTASFGPRVMGLDATFDGPKDPVKDSLFRLSVSSHKNLVMATRFDWKDKHQPFKKGYFGNSFQNEGHVNMVAEDVGTVRLWLPFEKYEGKKYPSFAAALVKAYNDTAYEKLVKRHKELELINYSRLINEEAAQYQLIEPEDLFSEGGVDTAAIRGKIALMGYVNLDPTNIEDKKFTPMNKKYYGKQDRDMNGIVVHANIISMVLERNYINKLPSWVNLVIAVLVGWLHMSFFIHYYLESHIWFHLAAKIAQVASMIFFVYLGIIIYSKYQVKLNMSMTLLTIVLAVDVIYFYEAWAVWMHKRFKYKTVFHAHGHGDGGHHGHSTHPKPQETHNHVKPHETPIPDEPNENSDHHT